MIWYTHDHSYYPLHSRLCSRLAAPLYTLKHKSIDECVQSRSKRDFHPHMDHNSTRSHRFIDTDASFDIFSWICFLWITLSVVYRRRHTKIDELPSCTLWLWWCHRPYDACDEAGIVEIFLRKKHRYRSRGLCSWRLVNEITRASLWYTQGKTCCLSQCHWTASKYLGRTKNTVYSGTRIWSNTHPLFGIL
jgi:hypothetical protein